MARQCHRGLLRHRQQRPSLLRKSVYRSCEDLRSTRLFFYFSLLWPGTHARTHPAHRLGPPLRPHHFAPHRSAPHPPPLPLTSFPGPGASIPPDFPPPETNLRSNPAVARYVHATLQVIYTFGWRNVGILTSDCTLDGAQALVRQALQEDEILNFVSCRSVGRPKACASRRAHVALTRHRLLQVKIWSGNNGNGCSTPMLGNVRVFLLLARTSTEAAISVFGAYRRGWLCQECVVILILEGRRREKGASFETGATEPGTRRPRPSSSIRRSPGAHLAISYIVDAWLSLLPAPWGRAPSPCKKYPRCVPFVALFWVFVLTRLRDAATLFSQTLQCS